MTPDTPADPLVISAESVLAVTDDAVVLGTTARWLATTPTLHPSKFATAMQRRIFFARTRAYCIC